MRVIVNGFGRGNMRGGLRGGLAINASTWRGEPGEEDDQCAWDKADRAIDPLALAHMVAQC